MQLQRRRTAARADIQGLRAVAVVAVIADHLLHRPSGGFIGVDVFFVISGFLITGLLMREYDRSGTISFTAFYVRRVKRIIPAALLTLIVTIMAARMLVNSGYAKSVGLDALWAALFGANWHFAFDGTDYLHATGPTSPVQHFWSLSVEEQFYFVWPWLMLAVILLAARRAWVRRTVLRVLLAAVGAIIVLSLVWSCVETSVNPTWSYFSTFSRAWELGLGALLALLAPLCARIPDRLRPVLAWLGLAGIAASLVVIDASSPFPGPWALAPTLATAVVIAAGTGGPVRYLWPLTNRFTVFVGDISYSLYLWHFPVVIIVGTVIPASGRRYLLLCAVLMAAFAIVSYYLVERPLHNSTWLRPRTGAPRAPRPGWRPVIGVASVLTVTVSLCLAPQLIGSPAPAAALARIDGVEIVGSPAQQANMTALKQALSATDWPELDPAVDELGTFNASVDEWLDDGCLDVTAATADRCAYGETRAPQHVAALLGDSYAISYLPALRAALGPSWKVQSLTMHQCPAADLSVLDAKKPFPACDAHHEFTARWIADNRPDLVVAVDTPSVVGDIVDAGGSWDAQRSAYMTAETRLLAGLSDEVAEVVVVEAPPFRARLTECRTAVSAPADCLGAMGAQSAKFGQAQREAVAKTDRAGVDFIPTQNWFCIANLCPSFIGNTPATSDGAHLTEDASKRLGPLLAEALAATDVDDTAG